MNDDGRFISEEQARRLWERAAELQAEAAQKEEARRSLPGSTTEASPASGTGVDGGYSLTHVRQAGLEAGIQAEFLNMALAEEAVLELEGGSGDRPFDRFAERFLGDRRTALELSQSFGFPVRAVWLALEEVLTNDPHDLELLEIRGGKVGEGGVAIFEAPKALKNDGSLKFLSTAVDTKRYLVRVSAGEDGGSTVLIRIPLRRSRRINGGVGAGFASGGGILGGLGAMAVVAAFGTGGLAALPLGFLLAGGGMAGAAGTGFLTRWGVNALYRSYMKKLEHTLRKILTRVERDLAREADETRGG